MFVSREQLRCIIHEVDPLNTSLRWNATLSRRKYSFPGPNSVWHIGMCSTIIMMCYFLVRW
jgi:hypothetical protein